jgi:hypothetical protein
MISGLSEFKNSFTSYQIPADSCSMKLMSGSGCCMAALHNSSSWIALPGPCTSGIHLMFLNFSSLFTRLSACMSTYRYVWPIICLDRMDIAIFCYLLLSAACRRLRPRLKAIAGTPEGLAAISCGLWPWSEEMLEDTIVESGLVDFGY